MRYIPRLTEHLLSLEKDISNGKLFAEHEHEFYIQFSNFDFLSQAKSMDMQEQWGITIEKSKKNDAKGSMRVRQIQAGSVTGGPRQTSKKPMQYVLTTKLTLDSGVRDEVPIPVSRDSFNLFAKFSDSGMIKHRYHFPVDGLVFELDLFLTPEGEYCEWAKLDLEVKDKADAIPAFPFSFDKMIKGDSEEQSDKNLISSLYKNYFITPNKFLNKKEDIDNRDPGDHEYR